MKKKITAAVCASALALALPLAACGSDKAVDDTTGQEAIMDTTQMANPFTECNTLEEAAAAAGFSIEVPDVIETYSNRTIRVMANSASGSTDGNLIEVIYYPASVEAGQATSASSSENASLSESDEIRVRKMAGSGDPSGDYNEYSTSTLDVDGTTVTLKSANGTVALITWERDGFSYSVGAYTEGGLFTDTIPYLVGAVQ